MPTLRGARALVTGAAGFIGPHLMRGLAKKGARVVGIDINRAAVARLRASLPSGVKLETADASDPKAVARLLRDCGVVFHLAADPDVRNSTAQPYRHFEQNALGLLSILEAMRASTCRRIVFPSTSTVYGDANIVPTPEDYHPLTPISVYGASKLAGEALLSSYCAAFGFDAVALRFANVVGPGATHGVIPDLVDKLKRDPLRLEVLGDGRQRKSYVYVDDLIAGTLVAVAKAPPGFQVYNVGSSDTLVVDHIANAVIRATRLPNVKIVHKPAPGGRGWAGDVKVMQLDISRLKALGFTPRTSSREAVEWTARAVAAERMGEGLTRK